MTAHTALLLIAHGSRQEEANADLYYMRDRLHERGRYAVVEVAFLELARPTIEEGAELCVRAGATRVVLMPYFLSAGVHVRRDLSTLCQTLGESYPQVLFHLAAPLGRHPLLVEVVADRAREAEEALIEEPRP